MDNSSPSTDSFKTLWTPIPSEPVEQVNLFFDEAEQTLSRLMTIVGYMGCLSVLLIVPIQAMALRGENLAGFIILLGILNFCVFIGLANYTKLPFNLRSHTAFLIMIVVVFNTSGYANVLTGQTLVSFIFMVMSNSFVAIMPWPTRPVRLIIAINTITHIILVTQFAGPAEFSTQTRLVLDLGIFVSALVGVAFHSILLRQRWHSFLVQHENKELTARLVNKTADLETANDTLQTKNDELDAFAHTVAHDLKNPLGGIIGYAEMLQEELQESEPDHEEAVSLSDQVVQLGLKSASIVNELLLLSSVRREEITTTDLEMGQIIEGTLQRLSQPVRELSPEITVPEKWPTAVGYAPWVEEIWTNYVSNALKYGGRPCKITLGADRLDNGQIQFWVQDNGEGLSAEQQAQLFTEFSRVHQAKIEGQGLGLSIVRRIIDKLDGQVGVMSELGNGSRFYFTLPAQQ